MLGGLECEPEQLSAGELARLRPVITLLPGKSPESTGS